MIKYTKNFILRGASENSVIARIMIVVGSLLLLSSSLLLLLFNNINNISMYIDMLMSNILAVTLNTWKVGVLKPLERDLGNAFIHGYIVVLLRLVNGNGENLVDA